MFGIYFYQDAPGVYKVGTVDEVRQAVEYLEEDRNSLSDEKVSAFLAALQDCTFPGWVDNRYADLSDLSVEENNSNIAKAIINCVDM